MRRSIVIVLVCLLIPQTVLAVQFGITPTKVEVNISGYESAKVTFSQVRDFRGVVEISLKDIPLQFSPTVAIVSPENSEITVNLFGDGSGKTYKGYIRLLPVTRDQPVGTGIQIPTTVHQTRDGLFSPEAVLAVIAAMVAVGVSWLIIRRFRERF